MPRLLIVEDDPASALALRELLAGDGYEVLHAADGRDALRLLFEERPALMLLDLGVPGLDGWRVLARTRDMSDLPVIVLSARDDLADLVRGLRGGADDYVVKPFRNEELLARVEALLRRSGAGRAGDEVSSHLRLLADRRTVLWHGAEVRLSDIEYRLLQLLVRNRGAVVTTEALLDRVWHDPTTLGRDRVKFAVLRVRRKLASAAGDGVPDPVESVRGVGYRFVGGAAGTSVSPR
ncbi:response regulator transcription factor [Streptomyces sp. NBC_00209]|uniref:response regulator transcription factor n=1 Tax=Streptomyces sp. NBC_00209 TaxID=2975682 RepID=UPI003248F369